MPGIAGVVLLYHPDEGLHRRISSYLGYVDQLYVIDNSEKDTGLHFDSAKISYLKDNQNKGIAARLNEAARLAIQNGYDWLLTMDQDSAFSSGNIEKYFSCVRNNKDNNVALFGVQFNEPLSNSDSCDGTDSLYLITSGSLVNLKLFPVIGDFDEALFIDQVDYEYSFRSSSKGYRTIQFRNIFLEHQLGTQTTHRSILNFKKSKRSLHAPVRIYYMTRNYLYMRSRYKKVFPAEMAHIKKDLLNRLKNNFLYSPERMSVVANFSLGVLDYIRKKMGKK
jgi:rhamnosyltransferase